MRGFFEYQRYPKDKLGDPIQWLPQRMKRQIIQEEQDRVRDICADASRMARAKDLAGVSDQQMLTVLKEALPPGWAPKSRHLLRARKEMTTTMQVSSPPAEPSL